MALAALVLTLSPTPVRAEDPPDRTVAPREPDNSALWNLTEAEPARVRAKASTVIALRYLLPTVTDPDDPRRDQNNQPEFNLRNAYLSFYGDIGHHALVRLTLSGRRVGELDVDDDGSNDDPDAGRLAIVLDRASLALSAHAALHVEAGVIRLPWSWASQDVWGLGIVANSAPRRYGMVEDSDLGVGLSGLFPLNLGGYHWAVYNGETRLHPERTPHKATGLKLGFRPFYHLHPSLKSLYVAGFGEFRKISDRPGDAINQRVSWAAMIRYARAPLRLGAEWMTAHIQYDEDLAPRIGGVGSVFLIAETSWWSQVFVRSDVRDPDLSQDGGRDSSRNSLITGNPLPADADGRLYLIAGAQFSLGGYIRIAPWAEAIFYQETHDGASLAPTVSLNTSLALRF